MIFLVDTDLGVSDFRRRLVVAELCEVALVILVIDAAGLLLLLLGCCGVIGVVTAC